MSDRITSNHSLDAAPCKAIPATRILIVDDDDVLRCLHETVLSHSGYGTESVSNGEEALVMLATGDFDLVLTDRVMPVLDGVGLIRALRRAGSRIPVMMVSGSLTDDGQLPADIRNEVAVALPKPASLVQLMSGIARALRWFPATQDTMNIMETEALTAAA